VLWTLHLALLSGPSHAPRFPPISLALHYYAGHIAASTNQRSLLPLSLTLCRLPQDPTPDFACINTYLPYLFPSPRLDFPIQASVLLHRLFLLRRCRRRLSPFSLFNSEHFGSHRPPTTFPESLRCDRAFRESLHRLLSPSHPHPDRSTPNHRCPTRIAIRSLNLTVALVVRAGAAAVAAAVASASLRCVPPFIPSPNS
jgi:hypothetical protein